MKTAATDARIRTKRSRETVRIDLPNRTRIGFRLGGGDETGLFGVSIAGVPVRDPAHPVVPVVATEEGWVFDRWRLRSVARRGDEVIVSADGAARLDYYQEKSDVYYGAIATEEVDRPRRATVRWFVRPHEVDIRGERYVGFGYRYEFESRDVVGHHILDRQSWEIGGRASGNTVINRGGYIRPEHTATVESRHTTSEEFLRVGGRRFTFMQLRPRFAYVQCFDFQTGPRGSLLMYFEDVNAIRSLLHKEAGRDRFQYFDDHWQEAGAKLSTTWRYVLFRPADRQPQDLWTGRNQWLRCWDFCAEHYRGRLGMPEGLPQYSFAFEYWTRNLKVYNRFLGAVAREFPRAAKLGYRLWYMGTLHHNNMTDDHDVVPNQITSHNPCCTLDYVMAKSLGGDRRIKALVAKARAHGLGSVHWMAGHLATEAPGSPIFEKHPEWRVLGKDGVIYCSLTRVTVPADFNTPYARHFLGNMRHWIRDLGISHLVCDSYPNFLIHVVNYADEKLTPQQDAALRIQAECAKLGAQWYVEGESPFGISSNGLAGPILGLSVERRRKTENLHRTNWTLDNFTGERQYVLYKTALRASMNDAIDGKIPADIFFRLAAYKAPLGLSAMYKTQMGTGKTYPEDRPDRLMPEADTPADVGRTLGRMPAALADTMRAYDRVCRFMDRAQILPGYAGSIWECRDGEHRVIFAFAPHQVTLKPGETVELVHGGAAPCVRGEGLCVEAGSVYLLSSGKASQA